MAKSARLMAEEAVEQFKARYIRRGEVDVSSAATIALSSEVRETIRNSGIVSLQVLLGSEAKSALKHLAGQYWAID